MEVEQVDLGGSKVDVEEMNINWNWNFKKREKIEEIQEKFRGMQEKEIMRGDMKEKKWRENKKRIEEIDEMKNEKKKGKKWIYSRMKDQLRFEGLNIEKKLEKGRVEIQKIKRKKKIGYENMKVIVEF